MLPARDYSRRSAEAQKALEQAMDTEKDPALRDLMKHIVNSRPAK